MAFLSTQDALRILKSTDYEDAASQAPPPLSVDVLPALQMLELNDNRLVDDFLPGRSIVYLQLSDTLRVSQIQALTSIQTLRCLLASTIPHLGIVELLDALRGMAPNLTTLGYLGGRSVRRISVLQALARFSSLRSIVINTEMHDEPITFISNQIPSLRTVITASCDSTASDTYRVMRISRPGYFETTVKEGGNIYSASFWNDARKLYNESEAD